MKLRDRLLEILNQNEDVDTVAVEFIELVRCGNCKYKSAGYCSCLDIYVSPDFFCANFERNEFPRKHPDQVV